jgi:hypothetical protein
MRERERAGDCQPPERRAPVSAGRDEGRQQTGSEEHADRDAALDRRLGRRADGAEVVVVVVEELDRSPVPRERPVFADAEREDEENGQRRSERDGEGEELQS